jgi:tetratricopeptide (TPR) repeat protein
VTHRSGTAALVVLLTLNVSAPARCSPASGAWTARGYALVYGLDYEEGMAALRAAVASDPNDAAAYRAIAAAALLQILFQRGSLTIDDYLGGVRPVMHMPSAPAALVTAFNDSVTRSIALADRRVRDQPRDPDAHYQVGASLALQASFTAAVEGHVMSALGPARRAYDEHERVLELDSRRKDAELVVGSYRYLVSTMPAPMRLMAYVAGFGGGRERGLAMIEEAANYPSDIQTDARFGLVILYNRERRFDDAMRVLSLLRREHPRNRLLWMAAGSTEYRAGHAARAVEVLDAGFAMLMADSRPRMFGEEALWRYQRGAALVALRRREAAENDLRAGLVLEARDWVRGRLRLELGKLADLAGNRARALDYYREAATFCQGDNDHWAVSEANRLLDTPYR